MSDLIDRMAGSGAIARLSDPVTSHEAAYSISVEGYEASEREVLTILDAAAGSLSAEEIFEMHEARQFFGLSVQGKRFSPSRVRTAVKQLVELDLVVEAERVAKTKTGRRARTWQLAATSTVERDCNG